MSTITKLEVNLSERYIPPEPTPEEPEEGSEEWCQDHLEDPRCEQYRPVDPDDPVDPTPEEPEEGSEEWCKTHQDSELCKEQEEDNEETGDAPGTGHHTILSVGDNNNTPTSTPFIVAGAAIALFVLVACFVKFFKHKKEDKNHYYFKQQKGYKKAYATILPVLSLALIAGIFARVFAYNYDVYPDLTASKTLTIDNADIIGTDEIRYVKDTLVLPKSNYGYELYIHADNNKLTSYNQGIYLDPVALTGALTENTFGYTFVNPATNPNTFEHLSQTAERIITKAYSPEQTKDGISLDIWWGVNAKSAEEANYELEITYDLHEQQIITELQDMTPEICADMPTDHFESFIDIRNNKTYQVYKDNFGRCNVEGVLTHDEGGNPTIEPISRDQFPDLDPEESICPTGWHEVEIPATETAAATIGCAADYENIEVTIFDIDEDGSIVFNGSETIDLDDERCDGWTCTFEAPAQPEGAEPGQEFYGWSTEIDPEIIEGQEKEGKYQPGDSIAIDSPNFALYPVWEKKTPKAILDTNRRLNFVYDYYSVEDAKNDVDDYKTNYVAKNNNVLISTTNRYNSETKTYYDDDDIYEVPNNSRSQGDLGWNSKDIGYYSSYLGNQSCGIFDVNFDNSFRDFKPTSLHSWFQGESNIASFSNMNNLDVSEVTDMGNLFFQMFETRLYCSEKGKPVNDRKLQIERGELVSAIDLSSWDINNVKNFYNFSAQNELDIDISGWASKTGNVTNMHNMFFDQKLTKKAAAEIEKFDTSSVESFEQMFGQVTLVDENNSYRPIDFMLNLSRKEISEKGTTYDAWDTSSATNFRLMFGGVNSQDNFLVNTTGWDTSKSKSFYRMFYDTAATNTWEVTGLEKFDTSSAVAGSISGIGYMFENAGAPNSDFEYDLSGWKGNADKTFYGFVANKFSPNLSNWELAPYYSYGWYNGWTYLFYELRANTFAPNLSNWNIASKTSSSSISIFDRINANIFAPEMTNWQIDKTNLTDMKLFNSVSANEFVPKLTIETTGNNLYQLFGAIRARKFAPTGTISSSNSEGITDIRRMFETIYAIEFAPAVTINNLGENVSASYMYYGSGCQSWGSLISAEECVNSSFAIADIDYSKVTNMEYMFAYTNIDSIDISGIDFANVTTVAHMFNDSKAKTIYDSETKSGRTSLNDLYKSSADINGRYMFIGASNLKGGNGTTYDYNNTNIEYAKIDRAIYEDGTYISGDKGYFTDACVLDDSCPVEGTPIQEQPGQQTEQQPPLMSYSPAPNYSYTPISEQSIEESTDKSETETPVSTGEEKKSTKKSDTKSEQTEPLGVKKSVEKASTVDTATIAVIVASFVLVSAGAVIIFLIEKRRNEDEE